MSISTELLIGTRLYVDGHVRRVEGVVSDRVGITMVTLRRIAFHTGSEHRTDDVARIPLRVLALLIEDEDEEAVPADPHPIRPNDASKAVNALPSCSVTDAAAI